MPNSNHSILIIEDDSNLLEIAIAQLEMDDYLVYSTKNGEEGLKLFKSHSPDIVLTDLSLKGSINGDEIIKQINKLNANTPVILMTAHGSIESAVECMKSGAFDYITKPFLWDEMKLIIKKALAVSDLYSENKRLRVMLNENYDFSSIIGESDEIKKIIKQLPRFSESNAPVQIYGESGVGKEMVAKAIHLNSSRKDKPFLAINCGSIPHELAESELFGHVKGAFTGAISKKNGYFIDADGGTLFLDEIGELPLDIQVKLLRVLQESQVTSVGSTEAKNIDVRIISASNIDLLAAVDAKEFREDLYFRLAVLPIEIPPLSKRKKDIPILAQYFLKKHGQENSNISEDLIQLLIKNLIEATLENLKT